MKLMALFALSAFSLAAAAPAIAQTVNVDGTINASLDGSNAVTAAFGAGTYNISFTDGLFTAFNRFGGSGGCDASGASCQTGYENSVRYVIDGNTFLLGDGAASGGLGPISGGGYYATAATSFANAGQYAASFTLNAPTAVNFFLYDDNISDNVGGVSLNVAAVPEPASWAMMILGMGAVGFAMRSAKRRSDDKFDAKIKKITYGAIA